MSMTTNENPTQTATEKADELERQADTLDSALLAPSMKSDTLRKQAAEFRKAA